MVLDTIKLEESSDDDIVILSPPRKKPNLTLDVEKKQDGDVPTFTSDVSNLLNDPSNQDSQSSSSQPFIIDEIPSKSLPSILTFESALNSHDTHSEKTINAVPAPNASENITSMNLTPFNEETNNSGPQSKTPTEQEVTTTGIAASPMNPFNVGPKREESPEIDTEISRQQIKEQLKRKNQLEKTGTAFKGILSL